MSIRGDIEQGVVALLEPLVDDAGFRVVGAVTKADLVRMVEQELPECPFALVSYAGDDGGATGEHHTFIPRISVFVGGLNLVSPTERRQEIYDLLDQVDGALMFSRIGAGYGPLLRTGEGLTSLTLDGVEVWEQVYKLQYSVQ